METLCDVHPWNVVSVSCCSQNNGLFHFITVEEVLLDFGPKQKQNSKKNWTSYNHAANMYDHRSFSKKVRNKAELTTDTDFILKMTIYFIRSYYLELSNSFCNIGNATV